MSRQWKAYVHCRTTFDAQSCFLEASGCRQRQNRRRGNRAQWTYEAVVNQRRFGRGFSSDSAAVLITLIHGTWARDAPWTQPTSELATALGKSLGDVRFERFSWSGANSHRARCRAAADTGCGAASSAIRDKRGNNSSRQGNDI